MWLLLNAKKSSPPRFPPFDQTVYEGEKLNHAIGLCHHGDFLFWNEYHTGNIYRLDQKSKEVTLLHNERRPIFQIHMYDAQLQQGMNVAKLLPFALHQPTLHLNG